MLKLARLGHVALRVADVERSKKFYGELLGFEVIEEDPEHGGVFMALPGSQPHHRSRSRPPTKRPPPRPARWACVTSRSSWRARRTSRRPGARCGSTAWPIDRAMDHVSQKSIYFRDPDGTVLEIYYELPNARELFRQGRGDRDEPLVFEP